MRGLSFDYATAFAPLTQIVVNPLILVVHPSVPARDLPSFVIWLKAQPQPVPYASSGIGTAPHQAAALWLQTIDATANHVPYRGGGPLMNDALAGHVPLSIGSVFLTKPHLDSKRLRALAVTTSKRSGNLPDVPTVAESGFAGFDAPAWWAVLAPAKTPPEVVRQMNAALNTVLKSPEVAAKLAGQGIDIRTDTPEAARAFIDAQIDTWAKVVKDNDIKAD